MSEYIGYRQTEELLSLYPEMKATIENLCIELSNGFLDEGELLSAKFLGNNVLTDMPQVHSAPGDKVLNTIAFKDRIISQEKKSAGTSIDYLDRAFAMLSVSLMRLPETWQRVIQYFYWEKRSWKSTAAYLDYHVDTCKKMRHHAITRITSMHKITPELYQECMKRLPPPWDNRRKEKD